MLCLLSLAVGGWPVRTSLNPWSLGSTILFASQTIHVWKPCHCAISMDGILFHRQLISLQVYLLFPHTHRSLLYWIQLCPTRLISSCWSWCPALILLSKEGLKFFLLVVDEKTKNYRTGLSPSCLSRRGCIWWQCSWEWLWSAPASSHQFQPLALAGTLNSHLLKGEKKRELLDELHPFRTKKKMLM